MYQVPLKLGIKDFVSFIVVKDVQNRSEYDTYALPQIECFSLEQLQKLANGCDATIFASLQFGWRGNQDQDLVGGISVSYFFTREWMFFRFLESITPNPTCLVVENTRHARLVEATSTYLKFKVGKDAALKPGHEKYLVS
jgi:hypothetical protein